MTSLIVPLKEIRTMMFCFLLYFSYGFTSSSQHYIHKHSIDVVGQTSQLLGH